MVRVVHEVLPQERQQRILEILRRDGRVVANELATSFGVSEDSIRRDLREMASEGLCRRIYGGALLPTPNFPPLTQRVLKADPVREGLAQYAAGLILPGQTILLDAGSTNVEIAKALRGKSVTVVTNAPAVATVLADEAITELVVIGGRVDPRSGGAIGSVAIQQLSTMQADVSLLGACAVEPDYGAWGVNGEEAAFKQAMARASDAVIIVATDDKVGARGACQLIEMAQIDHLVIRDTIPKDLADRFAKHESRLHQVNLSKN